MLEKLLSNASVLGEETAYFKFKSPYQALALAPKNRDFQMMRAQLDSNQQLRFWRPTFYH